MKLKIISIGILFLRTECSFINGNNIISSGNGVDTLLMTAKILSTAGNIQKTIYSESEAQNGNFNKNNIEENASKNSNMTREEIAYGIMQCNIDKDGLCCLMPNYCSKEAICKSEIVGQQTYIDYLNAFPRCQCLPGYSGDGRTKGTGCKNINECLTGEANCEQLCTDYSPGYACSCNLGFRLNQRDMKTCIDIDECSEGRHNCSHKCVNTRGSFVCECPKGYKLDTNNKDCIDIDECKENNGLGFCEYGCKNLPGSFECQCPKGYKLDINTQKCVDIDECSDFKDLCNGFGEICVNNKGGYECKCAEGYFFDELEKTCKDIDECLSKTHNCTSDTLCINEIGGFSCKCLKEGFKFNLEKRICEDIDECLTGESNCDQICINTFGSYKCGCHKGFKLNSSKLNQQNQFSINGVCVDIDECSEIPHLTGCSHGCNNIRGSFQCTCPKGFQLKQDGKTCEDIDECRRPENPCRNNKQYPCCKNTLGSFICVEQVKVGEIFKRSECPHEKEFIRGDSTSVSHKWFKQSSIQNKFAQ